MQTIYKYQLSLQNEQALKLPLGAKILSVDNQNEQLVLWALVDPNQKIQTKTIIMVFVTGQEVVLFETTKFLNTVLFENGRLIFHVFMECEIQIK